MSPRLRVDRISCQGKTEENAEKSTDIGKLDCGETVLGETKRLRSDLGLRRCAGVHIFKNGP